MKLVVFLKGDDAWHPCVACGQRAWWVTFGSKDVDNVVEHADSTLGPCVTKVGVRAD